MATKLERAQEGEKHALDQLADAKEVIAHQEKEIVRLTAEAKTANSSKDAWYKKMCDATAEVDQVHLLLDAMQNPPARKGPANEYNQAVAFNLMTRLAAWLATRGAA